MEQKANYADEIKQILSELETLGYDRKRAAKEANYTSYKTFSSTLSRGGNKAMLDKLIYVKKTIEQRLNNPAFEALDIIKEMKAMQDIMFSAIAELVARNTGQSATVVREQFQKMVEDKLKKK